MKEPPGILMAELRWEVAPAIDVAALLPRITELAGTAADLLASNPTSAHLAFPAITMSVAEGDVPMQVLIATADAGKAKPLPPEAFAHSWSWPEAQSVLANASGSMLITDLLGRGADRGPRLRAWHAVVRAVVEAYRPAGIHLVMADRVVAPAWYLETLDEDPTGLAAILHVRHFRPPDGVSTVMDTVGLAPFLLPDVQLHFVDFDPNDAARWLWNVAWYLFERGDVIEDGHTIAGIDQEERWRCQHEVSMAAPERVVLDANPGRHGPSRAQSAP